MKDATLKMIREWTPESEGIIEIQSRYGVKRITATRLIEITLEADERNCAEGKDRLNPDNFNRLLLEEIAPVC
jgi:hypothetical protein